MASGLSALWQVGWVAVGLPPHQGPQGEPLGWAEWIMVVAGLIVGFYCSVRLVALLDVKISSFKLFSEPHRDLETRRRPPFDSP